MADPEPSSTAAEAELSPPSSNPTASTADSASDRKTRFEALRKRQAQSRKDNLKETAAEQKRLSTDPSLLTSLNRQRDIAQHKLLRADAAAAGEDFERKRAWDWTIDEAAKWDERLVEKKRKRDGTGFADYRAEAGKVYERQIEQLEKGGGKALREKYEKDKREMVQRAVESGGLEVVETEDGELIAVDRDGKFYSTAESTEFVQSKPDRAAVDRLVADIRKAEEVRLKKRRERGRDNADDGGDVTYINEKNKQFNEKLKRFYDKYTTETRDNFERGTAI